ncbi:hypothetical protein MtrunA17_Chr5g0435141 [Medicago truncatula]|uniref:Transmembrane protein n=1 Tax=Medicago truncatula TaxID=3880 RepID=A0A396HUE0_MEDTR|nr:hypothetical protein MtrunA17_Chr5g0435141 [Medicago truncatula]
MWFAIFIVFLLKNKECVDFDFAYSYLFIGRKATCNVCLMACVVSI